MKKPSKVKEESIIKTEELLEADEVLSKLTAILTVLQDKPMKDWSMHRLSDAVSELSSLLVNLGRMVTDARLEWEIAEEYRKSAFREIFLKLKVEREVSDAVAKATAEQRVEDLIVEELELKHMSSFLQNFYNDIERLISVSQSRMKLLGGEQIRSNT